MVKSKYMYHGWRRKVAVVFYLVTLLNLVMSIERLVFDVFGQMWGTMLLNGMSLICTITGLLGTCIKEKIAMAVYIGWSLLSIVLNIIIVLVYQDVGLLAEKEHFLGLIIGNDNWWRTHGIDCGGAINTTLLTNQTDSDNPLNCAVSYVTIETIHAAVNMFLTVVSMILILPLLSSRKRERKARSQADLIDGDDDEDFSYVNIAQWYDYPNANSNRRGQRWQRSHGKTTIS